jgi:hypothetical protein
MALNPFFLQGSPGEQRLVQELINEQLKIYGVDVTYIPRKFVRKETILEEISSSKFDDNYVIEAYISTYDGFGGQGDILTKFGMSLRDELVLIISRERFEDFITPFLGGLDEEEIELTTRPREGDLIYFPLGQRLFEVKFVEHEQPFYQLGKNYVYELRCELFEYEDEVLDTSIEEIDTQLQDQGHIYTLDLIGVGRTATAYALLAPYVGYVERFFINDDGYGYTSTPSITISPPPADSSPGTASTARAVAITTSIGGVRSIKDILFVSAGYGYTEPPTVTVSGGGGTGAAVTCNIVGNTPIGNGGVIQVVLTDNGVGYTVPPKVTIESPPFPGIGITATAVSVVGSGTSISNIYLTNTGYGYPIESSSISVSIDPPPVITGIGTFMFNEEVVGEQSRVVGRVKNWNAVTKKLKVSIVDGQFYPGETIVGASSSAVYSIKTYSNWNDTDKYNQNLKIQQEASNILDFSESNPFGTY